MEDGRQCDTESRERSRGKGGYGQASDAREKNTNSSKSGGVPRSCWNLFFCSKFQVLAAWQNGMGYLLQKDAAQARNAFAAGERGEDLR